MDFETHAVGVREIMSADPERRHVARARVAFFAGPLAWTVQLVAGYALVPEAQAWHSKVVLHVLSGGLLLPPLIAGWWAWRQWRSRRPLPVAHAKPSEPPERIASPLPNDAQTRFALQSALTLNAFFVLVIVAEDLPVWIVQLGDR